MYNHEIVIFFWERKLIVLILPKQNKLEANKWIILFKNGNMWLFSGGEFWPNNLILYPMKMPEKL